MSVGPGDFVGPTLQGSAVATGNGTSVDCVDGDGAYTLLTVQVQGITTATITWEATIDESTWVAVPFTNLATGTAATTATADGLYRFTIAGLVSVRARISSYTSGTINVRGILVA